MRWLEVALGTRLAGAQFPLPESRRRKRRPALSTWLFTLAVGFLLPAFASGSVDVAEDDELLPSNDAPRAVFGESVAIDGDTAVVGAPQASGLRGAAYVFTRSGGTWVQQQQLTASDASRFDEFGASVAIAGDTIVVGARRDGFLDASSTFVSQAGSAYVFTRSGGVWSQQQKLTATTAREFDKFGVAVAIAGDPSTIGDQAGDTIVVGSPGFDFSIIEDCGAAYVFRFDGTTGAWEREATLLIPGLNPAAAGDEFGQSVAVAGDAVLGRAILVGAWYDDLLDRGENIPNTDEIFHNAGSAHVYRYDDAIPKWVPEITFLGHDNAAASQVVRARAIRDKFGRSVAISGNAISGNTAVIGAPGDSLVGADAGSADVYGYAGGVWAYEDTLVAEDAAASDQFGISVGVAANYVVLGAWGSDVGGDASGTGYVFEFEVATSTWEQELKLVASDGSPFDDLGFSAAVAIAGDRVVVGAAGHDHDGQNSGSAYVFSVPEPSVWLLQMGAIAALAGLARTRSAKCRVRSASG